ncbi:hypothetical protein Tco_0806360 [Tanacetum coccineum]
MKYEKLSQKLTFYKAFFSPQWKFLIHTILQCLSAKTTAWNEFSSTMASAIICLATNQKFNFSKYIFESMVKNLDNAGKFLMYPRFIQVFLNNQLEGMSSHKSIYITPSHTKKIFVNMRRQGKDFSGRETPLFPTMVVQAQEEMGEGSAMPTDPHHTPIITQPSSSQRQRKQKSRRPKEKDTQELMDFCTKLQQRVLDLENTKTAQAQEITSLKKRVKKLEKKGGEDESQSRRKIDDIDKDAEISLVDETRKRYEDEDMFGVNDLDGDEVVVESEVTNKAGEKRNIVEEAVVVTDVVTIPVSAATITNIELTLAQTLAELKSARPKTKGVVIQESSESTPTISLHSTYRLRVSRLAREKAQQVEEANIAWDDIQAKIDADYQLAERLNMAGWKPKDLKNKSFANIQELFDKAFKRVNTFVDFITELVEGTEMEESSKKAEVMEESSSKIAGGELEHENVKKQKVDDDQEATKLKELIKIILDEEEVAVDAIPLATKPPSIVDWNIIKEGKIGYYQIIRVDGSSKRYSAFIQMFGSFDMEDLETLWKLVKAKHGYTRLEEGYERVIWGDLKTMFEYHVEDAVWRNLQENKVLV